MAAIAQQGINIAENVGPGGTGPAGGALMSSPVIGSSEGVQDFAVCSFGGVLIRHNTVS